MASLKEMRNRISSVKATQKITKAMQMVAAAKLKRSQDAAQNARPYAERMSAVISNLAAGVSGDGAPRLLAGTGSDKRHLIVVAAADRGLAGGFETSGQILGALRSNALYGRPDDYQETLASRTRALTAADMDAAARATIDPSTFVWVVVGDASVVRPQLDALGLPVEVRPAQ